MFKQQNYYFFHNCITHHPIFNMTLNNIGSFETIFLTLDLFVRVPSHRCCAHDDRQDHYMDCGCTPACRWRPECYQSPMRVSGLLGSGLQIRKCARYTNAPMMVFLLEGTVVATRGRFIQTFGFLLIILVWLINWVVGAWRQGSVSFSQKNTKNLRNHQIYIKMQKYCDFITFIFFIR